MYHYTAIFGDKDVLNPTPFKGVIYTDKPGAVKGWEYRVTPHLTFNSRISARQCKTLSHFMFPLSEYSVWTDGHLELLQSPQILVDMFLQDADIAVFKHPARNCVYEEANVCKWHVLDTPAKIDSLMNEYSLNGYPKNNGLIESGVMIRRHTKKIKELNREWWKAILNKSFRDQLSFNYLCWKLDIKYNIIPGVISKDNGIVKYHGHR